MIDNRSGKWALAREVSNRAVIRVEIVNVRAKIEKRAGGEGGSVKRGRGREFDGNGKERNH